MNRITAFIRKYCASEEIPKPETQYLLWPNGKYYGYDSNSANYCKSIEEALTIAMKQPANKHRGLIITEDVRYIRYTFNEAGEPIEQSRGSS